MPFQFSRRYSVSISTNCAWLMAMVTVAGVRLAPPSL
jgi:hypothetical protein